MANPMLSSSPEAVMRADATNGAVTVATVAVLMLAGAADATATGIVAPASAPASASAVRRVVVSIPDRKLAVIHPTGEIEVYDVAVGKPSTPSPVGTFTIVNRLANPTYWGPTKTIAPGAGNPLGTRWMGLSEKGYGIHGTSDPSSIGLAKSKGCIRLRNADVERLYERLRTGDIVELHAERTDEIQKLFPAVGATH